MDRILGAGFGGPMMLVFALIYFPRWHHSDGAGLQFAAARWLGLGLVGYYPRLRTYKGAVQHVLSLRAPMAYRFLTILTGRNLPNIQQPRERFLNRRY